MDPVNLLEYEALARERMDRRAFDYIAGGAADEISLRENRTAFERITLLPRVLVDVSRVDPTVALLGRRVAFPVLVAPMAFQTLAHPEGERAVARAAGRAGTIMLVSTLASIRLEDVAAASDGSKWFQLYSYRDREITRALIDRAEAAGYEAICLTVDVPRVGRRERDLRNAFGLPPHARAVNFEGLVPTDSPDDGEEFARYVNELIDPSLTWEAVDWLCSITELPVLLKGILRPDDARRAVEHGAAGIVVSNHGARQLDTVPATIAALPEIEHAVRGETTILLDGGVRRGTDVIKALALGADAVLLGRPVLWGLAVEGEDGAYRVLEQLRTEVENAMALMGCARVGDLGPENVRGET